MECDDSGVALVVPSGVVRFRKSRSAHSRGVLLNSKGSSSRKDYQSDAEVVALHSRRRELFVLPVYHSDWFRFIGCSMIQALMIAMLLVVLSPFVEGQTGTPAPRLTLKDING